MSNCISSASIVLLGVSLALSPSSAADRLPLAEQLLTDAGDGRLDQHDLIAACLIASGVEDAADLRDRRARIDAVLEGVELPAAPHVRYQSRATDLLEELHRDILTGHYDKHASDLCRAASTGDYNCLTATALYAELCRRFGVPLEIHAQPGHVFCMVGSPPQRIEPAARRLSSASLVPTDCFARPITSIQLAARFAYNRGIELLERRHFEPGIASLRLACQLDPQDTDARTNLLAGLNNWALALAEQDQPAAAAALISRGLAIDPHFAPLVANERYIAERVRPSSP